ncbi:MAG: thioredoxin [Acidimicrobiales bacterium]
MTDVTDATFDSAVLTRSAEVPVVVDLWAAWCGPCRTLGPILEKVVAETAGAVELAKVDIDQNPRVAATFRAQSIPAVFALRNGQVVDHFIGAQPEAMVRAFIERLAPVASKADRLVALGDEFSLRAALDLEPDHEGAVVALADLLVGRGGTDEALALLARVPGTAETRRVAAAARVAAAGGPPAGDGVDARLGRLLDLVRDDESARREFLDLLELLGPDDPRTPRYRRAFSSRLF